MSVRTVLADYEPWPVVNNEDYRRETMTAADYAVAQFLDSLTVPKTAQEWLDHLADGDAATTNPDASEARRNTFINETKEF